MESVIDCTICYEKFHESDFFSLECCTGKRICIACLRCLVVPLCPYCRSIIPEIKDDPKYRMSRSYVNVDRPMLLMQSHFLAHHGLDIEDELLDPRILDSRILRRRMRRMRKLQLREEDRERNRNYHRYSSST